MATGGRGNLLLQTLLNLLLSILLLLVTAAATLSCWKGKQISCNIAFDFLKYLVQVSNLWYRVLPHSHELVAEVAALSKRGPARVTICSGGFKKDLRGGSIGFWGGNVRLFQKDICIMLQLNRLSRCSCKTLNGRTQSLRSCLASFVVSIATCQFDSHWYEATLSVEVGCKICSLVKVTFASKYFPSLVLDVGKCPQCNVGRWIH